MTVEVDQTLTTIVIGFVPSTSLNVGDPPPFVQRHRKTSSADDGQFYRHHLDGNGRFDALGGMTNTVPTRQHPPGARSR